MRRGYARVSTRGQNLGLQLDALKKAEVDTVYTDRMSGAKQDRPELKRLLADLQEGDVLVVWRLDRLGRSLRHLLLTIEQLQERGIGFESIHDKVDTTSATGRLVLHILGALAQFERELTRERIAAGLAAARARGRKLGRKTVVTPELESAIVEMLEAGMSPSQISRITGIGRTTLYRHSLTSNADEEDQPA